MGRWITYLMAIALGICMCSCEKNTIYGSGLQVEDVRTISGGYTSVSVRNGLRLVIDPSLDKNMVTVKCDEELLSNVSIKVFKNTLTVGYKNIYTIQTPLITEVHIPDVSDVSSFDVKDSQMTSDMIIYRDSLNLTAVNSEVSFGVQLKKLDINASSNATIRLQGYAEECNLTLNNSSIMERRFSTDVCNAVLVGSSLSLGCDRLMTATLSDGSRLDYHGNCTADITQSADSEVVAAQ
ncbi:MAG: DUF2807 domain-containing protein [Rikenellaceae bacterium]|nr:DUF2807 domain-containing protein [Rikenellaceae bacterium]MBO5758746.1 DUF2807 domain-containing protein [Rikenellaceae bacterium]